MEDEVFVKLGIKSRRIDVPKKLSAGAEYGLWNAIHHPKVACVVRSIVALSLKRSFSDAAHAWLDREQAAGERLFGELRVF